MHLSVLHRAAGGHQRLARHLATEDTLALLVGLNAAEDVHLDRFEVKQIDEELKGHRSPAHVRRPAEWASQSTWP